MRMDHFEHVQVKSFSHSKVKDKTIAVTTETQAVFFGALVTGIII